MTKSRCVAPPRRPWAEHELGILRHNYAHFPTAKIAAQLGRDVRHVYSKAAKLGLHKSARFFARSASGRILQGGALGQATQFKPGSTPWNKGKTYQALWRSIQTQFKPGNRPHTWVPVGTRRINSDGYVELKFSDAPGRYDMRWRGVHRMVWEAAHGPCPAGSVIVFKPGRRTTVEADITLDAIECITRAENMRRNSVHARYPELGPVVRAMGALTRQINRKAKESSSP